MPGWLIAFRNSRDQGWSFVKIAEQLNSGGISTGQTSRVPQRNAQPTGAEAGAAASRRTRDGSEKIPNQNEWLVIDLAEKLGIAKNTTLFNWIKRAVGSIWSGQSPGYHELRHLLGG